MGAGARARDAVRAASAQRMTYPWRTLGQAAEHVLQSACPHHNRVKVWSGVGGWDLQPLQRKHLREQCCDCGKLFGRDFSHSLATPDTPGADLHAARCAIENEEADRVRRSQEILEDFEEQRLREDVERRERTRRTDEEWWNKYNAYLLTPEWQARRMLVYKRAGDVCEGCRERRATEIHHLTYRHVTNEFCWELVAICDACHTRVHAS
jgi:hypothetical protein